VQLHLALWVRINEYLLTTLTAFAISNSTFKKMAAQNTIYCKISEQRTNITLFVYALSGNSSPNVTLFSAFVNDWNQVMNLDI
jgi:hypothetical protein